MINWILTLFLVHGDSLTSGQSTIERPAVSNLATVAIVPVSDDVPLANFTLELQCCLNYIGKKLLT